MTGTERGVSVWSRAQRSRAGVVGAWGLLLASVVLAAPVPTAGDPVPPAWRSWWALLLYALVAAAALVAVGRMRLTRLRRHYRSLAVQVDRQTRELREKIAALEASELAASEARQRLAAAEERVSLLLDASPRSLESLAGWLQSGTEELSVALGCRCRLWTRDGGGLVPLAGEDAPSPALEEPTPALEELERAAERRSWVEEERGTLVPVVGLSGLLLGAIALDSPLAELEPRERRLVSTFARHVGSALELRQTRRQLAGVEERRQADRQKLIAEGHELLQICPRCHRCFDHRLDLCPHDGAVLRHTRRMLPYRIAGRYRLERIVEEGAIGTIYAADDEKLRRAVAVKVLNQAQLESPETQARFQQETRAIARVRHPGVVTLFDSGELADGSGYLVMELLEGDDLGHLLAAFGPGTPAQVARLLRLGAAALEAAHLQGLIHRDIKPQNIFLAVDPADGFTVKLLDFGLAKEMRLDAGLTQSGLVVGTPIYMSPEQIQERPLGPKSDLYSFAAVCYEALTGRRTVESTEMVDVFVDVMRREAPPVSTVLPDAPPEIDAAFAAALAKDPAQRPPSLTAWARFADLLEAVPSPPLREGWRVGEARLPREQRRRGRHALPPTQPGMPSSKTALAPGADTGGGEPEPTPER